jgi:hypothetical protein
MFITAWKRFSKTAWVCANVAMLPRVAAMLDPSLGPTAKQALNNKKQIKNGKAKLSQMFDEALVRMEGNADEIAAM